MDGYQALHPILFENVIQVIHKSFIPVFKRHALSGECRVVLHEGTPSYDVITSNTDVVAGMIIDILADRDFSVIAFEHCGDTIKFSVRFHSRGLQHKEN